MCVCVCVCVCMCVCVVEWCACVCVCVYERVRLSELSTCDLTELVQSSTAAISLWPIPLCILSTSCGLQMTSGGDHVVLLFSGVCMGFR